MPQRRAAKKYLRQNHKRRLLNLTVKDALKSAVKKFKRSLASADAASREKALREAYSVIDKTAAKKIIHKKKAARKKSRLANLLKKVSASKS